MSLSAETSLLNLPFIVAPPWPIAHDYSHDTLEAALDSGASLLHISDDFVDTRIETLGTPGAKHTTEPGELYGSWLMYNVHRNLLASNGFVVRTIGKTLEAWIIEAMFTAKRHGQPSFRIVVLGPGMGNTEVELVKKIAPFAKALGMPVEMVAFSLPEHPMAPANIAELEKFADIGITVDRRPGDFDKLPLPDNVDILYAIKSTIYSKKVAELTTRIHDSLRKPAEGRRGGEAFMMFDFTVHPLFSSSPALTMLDRPINFLLHGFDISLAEIDNSSNVGAHIVRTKRETIGPIKDLVRRVKKEEPVQGYRFDRDKIDIEGYGVYDAFALGARLLFSGNGLSIGDDRVSELWATLEFNDVPWGMPVYDVVAVSVLGKIFSYESVPPIMDILGGGFNINPAL